MVNKRQAVPTGEAAWLGRAAGVTRGTEEPGPSREGGANSTGKGDYEVISHCFSRNKN